MRRRTSVGLIGNPSLVFLALLSAQSAHGQSTRPTFMEEPASAKKVSTPPESKSSSPMLSPDVMKQLAEIQQLSNSQDLWDALLKSYGIGDPNSTAADLSVEGIEIRVDPGSEPITQHPELRFPLRTSPCPTCLSDAVPDTLPPSSQKSRPITIKIDGGTSDQTALIPQFLPTGDAAEQARVWQTWFPLINKLSTAHKNSVVRLIYEARRNCTGVLITSDIVLTAGHCVDVMPSHVNVGPLFDSQSRTEVDQRSCRLHPGAVNAGPNECGRATKEVIDEERDLAIIRLRSPVRASLAKPAHILVADPPAAPGTIAASRSMGDGEYLGRMVGFGSVTYSQEHDDPKDRQHAPAVLQWNSTGQVSVRSPTAAAITSGDSGGPSFVTCGAAQSPQPETLVGINVADVAPRESLASDLVRDETRKWLEDVEIPLLFLKVSQCQPISLSKEPTNPVAGSEECPAEPFESWKKCLESKKP